MRGETNRAHRLPAGSIKGAQFVSGLRVIDSRDMKAV